MSPERWQKLKQIFAAAASVAPDERAQFLDERCGDDKELRREVENLLESDAEARSFIESPLIKQVANAFAGAVSPLKSGARIAHYEILKPLGAGGMGEVYLAEDEKLDRRVALKLLPSAFSANDEANRRLLREARAAAMLDHPNICQIYEIGESDGQRFIVMQFVEGETLAERMKRELLSVREAVNIAAQVADALAEAHGQNIIHRDIKPSNIIITKRGQAKVLDFGLAKFIVEERAGEESETAKLLSATGAVMGTVPYMSPEQARGERLEGRTDIFSLGVMLYEMLSGGRLFLRDSNAETIAAILTFEPPIDEQLKSAPAELRCIVKKSLAKDKAARYQTADELLRDLRALQERFDAETHDEQSAASGLISQNAARAPNETLIINTAGQNEKTQILQTMTAETQIVPPSSRRKFFIFGALASVFVALVLAGVWLMRAWRESFPIVNVQRTTQLTIWAGLDDFPAISPDGNSVAYCSDHNGSFEIYVKSLTPGAKEIQLTNDGQQNFEPAWSPDGKRIAYYSKQRGGIWTVPATGGEARQLTDFGSHPAWSPDGKQIAFQSSPLTDLGSFARNALSPSTLWLVAADGGEPPRQLTQAGTAPGGQGSPAWSPDGKRIAFEVNTYNLSYIWTIAADGSDARPLFPQRDSPSASLGYAPTYAPDGKSVLYHRGTVFQVRVNPATGEAIGESTQVTSIAQLPSAIRRVSFSADGKRIAYNVLRRTESIASVRLQKKTSEAAGAPFAVVSNATGRNNFPVFSPDGRRIAYSSCSVGGSGCDIWLANSDGSNQTQLTTSEANELLPSWFPDGKQIAYISDIKGYRSLWAINLNTKREQMLLDVKSNLEYARLSPDGKQVAFNFTRDGVINVWTAMLGGEPKQLTFDKEQMGFPAWSPDGKFLAFQVKRGDDTNVVVMPSDGRAAPEQITFDKGQSWVFDWLPDSDKVLFAGQRNGFWNVWWVSRATKKEQQLTDYKKLNSFVRYPACSPKGDQIAYEYSETTGNIWVADLR
jgi:Tol biopolymer transport system component/predicted Ser/Thr protein kinase